MILAIGLILLAVSCDREDRLPPTLIPTSSADLPKLPTMAPESEQPATAAPETPAEPPATEESATAQPTLETTRTAEPDEPDQADQATAEPEALGDEIELPEGALIAVSLAGKAGVLLDEIPASIRERAAAELLEKPDSFWLALAERQVNLTKRRLNFRNFAYPGKGQLPLPPAELWSIELAEAGPDRETIDGHDLVVIEYDFSSTLLTDEASPGEAEPALGVIGGKWDEPFVLPVDPDLLFQRTGNACLNEAGFPPNSLDSENAWVFFDYTCEGDSGGVLGCHRTRLNSRSCLQALADEVGTVATDVKFERLDWDPGLADQVRVGDLTQLEGPDLQVFGDDLEINRIIYRYFPEDSCAILEQCVSDSGWRRLLQFNATVHNVGGETMYIGPVVAENPINNLFQYNACHAHFHFSDYGDFYFAGEAENISSKQAFCVESTNRFSNNEFSPLVHDYTCRVQGVQTGWVDEYVAGLDCQWIDITDVAIDPEGSAYDLGFLSNPDGFLCEGDLVRDEAGDIVWEPSGQTTPDGRPINRPACDFVPDWDQNNEDARPIVLQPAGSFVTEPCATDLFSPWRNCGFSPQSEGVRPATRTITPTPTSRARPEVEPPADAFACQPGQTVQLSCSVADDESPQVLRICDYSLALGTGVACTYQDALANQVVGGEAAELSFTCPSERSEDEPGGFYALYTAPVLSGDPAQPISCEVID